LNWDRCSIIPIRRLQELKQDMEAFKHSEELNGFQNYIVDQLYLLDPPDAGFAIRSIIVCATPIPLIKKMAFDWKGKRVPLMIPAANMDVHTVPERIEAYLSKFLGTRGYHLQYEPRLPLKRLAVRSGLAVYGRNNISYIEGIGSSYMLTAYLSDVPCTEEVWYAVRKIDACNSCRACQNHCPTGAITAERFLLDNEQCLTYFNEGSGEQDFPEWIDPSWHNCIYGCLQCQIVCPQNKHHLDGDIEILVFSKEETRLILGGQPFECWPKELADKIRRLDEVHDLLGLRTNIKVLLEQAC
jgi:epoxyqueuosine reductase